MFYQGQMMNQNPSGCGCSSGCPVAQPTCQQCNQVVQTCNVQDVPHYMNYHTHVVNNCIKRHINIPTYSTSTEDVMINEYVQGQPIYQQGMPYQAYNQSMMQQPATMQSDFAGVNPTGYQGMNQAGYQGMSNPMNQAGYPGMVPPLNF